MIRKLYERASDARYALMASATVALMAGEANAQQNAGDLAKGLTDQAGNVGKLMVAGSFIGGLVMLATGLMKLKQAAENPNQTKYSEGMWRLGVGAGLVAIPAFSGMLGATFNFTGGASITDAGGASF